MVSRQPEDSAGQAGSVRPTAPEGKGEGFASRSRLEAVLPGLYEELRLLAKRAMAGERAGHTLQPTAVAHEAFLRMAGPNGIDPKDRTHFLAVAATQIRRILVDHARARLADKRGGGGAGARVTLSGIDVAADIDGAAERQEDVLAIDAALQRLAALSARASRVVELRFFAGLTVDEVAESLGVSPRTVADDWVFAKSWLRRELRPADDAGAEGE